VDSINPPLQTFILMRSKRHDCRDNPKSKIQNPKFP
jgi:hypothetical protein